MCTWHIKGYFAIIHVVLALVILNSSSSVLDEFVCRIMPVQCLAIKTELFKDHYRTVTESTVRIHSESEGKHNVTLYIAGTSKTAIIFGLNYYLKHICKTSLTQFGLTNQNFILKALNRTIFLSLNQKILFYGNICVYSYSYWMWTWDVWESHIDWIAMNGFNMVYVPVGIELVLLETFKWMGVKQNDAMDFFNGPAYLAWSRMGNMKSYTGPLTLAFIDNQKNLQKKIKDRFAELNITVAVPGFSGFVPDSLAQIYDPIFFNNVSCWNNFNESYSCLKQLDPTKSLYPIVGGIYMKFLSQIYGIYDFYAIDMFNENTPKNDTAEYLQACGKNTIAIIKTVSPSGRWLLQGWTFGYDLFWSNKNIEAYLSYVQRNDILILDMFDKRNRTWMMTNSYFGKPFIWALINNFGGNTAINGNILRVIKDMAAAFNVSKYAVGFGFMPEGVHENTILLDAVMQYSLESVQLDDPVRFFEHWKNKVSNYRYSNYKGNIIQDIVKILYSSSSNHDGSGHYEKNYIIYRRPDLNMPFAKNSQLKDNLRILKKYSEIIRLKKVTEYNNVFLYDLSSILQNSAEIAFFGYYKKMQASFFSKNFEHFREHANILRRIIQILDEALKFIPFKSLPCHLKEVKGFAVSIKDDPEKLSSDLKRQITLWGYHGEILDYAFKMWSNVLKFYYGQRWSTLIDYLEQALNKSTPFDREGYINTVSIIENKFVYESHPGICYNWDDTKILILNNLINEFIDLVAGL